MFNLQKWINKSLAEGRNNYTIARIVKAMSEFALATVTAGIFVAIGLGICITTPIQTPNITSFGGGLVTLGGMFYSVETNCHFGNGEDWEK